MAKLKRRQDDKSQSERFIENARELESGKSGEAFDRALKKIPLEKRNPHRFQPDGHHRRKDS